MLEALIWLRLLQRHRDIVRGTSPPGENRAKVIHPESELGLVTYPVLFRRPEKASRKFLEFFSSSLPLTLTLLHYLYSLYHVSNKLEFKIDFSTL